MKRRIVPTLVLAALTACSAAQADDDPPGRVGRISAAQGTVTVTGEGEPAAAMLNWPVTTGEHISTARGARAEFRVGAAAVRLDGDTDLEVSQLDDDNVRLRLNYGSASVRLRGADMLRDFELSTPEARVIMSEPGWLRVDAERMADTTTVSVLAGAARVDGAGGQLTLSSGRRADIGREDVHTGLARRDAFDNWAETRDRQYEASIATRYVPTEITGYEELDRNGSWTDSVEYGPLWTPRVIASDWAPYRDGRWIWMTAWGWTWVDNAPWGYAPSHYGRWVVVNRRWCWAPGRYAGRPVWAPALVGWVGGTQVVVPGRDGHHSPGLGWYPLTPHERYVPAYRVSVDQQRRMVWNHAGKAIEHHDGRPEQWHHDGVTVLPRDQFEAKHMVQVNKSPHVTLAPAAQLAAPLVAAPAPAGPTRVVEPRWGDWNERREQNGRPAARPDSGGQPLVTQGQPNQSGPARPQQVPGAPSQIHPLPQQLSPLQPQVSTQNLNAHPAVRVLEPHREAVPAGVPTAAPVAPEERNNHRYEHPGRNSEEGRRQVRPEQEPMARPTAPAVQAHPMPEVRQPVQPQQMARPVAPAPQAQPSQHLQHEAPKAGGGEQRKEAVERHKEEERERNDKKQPAR